MASALAWEWALGLASVSVLESALALELAPESGLERASVSALGLASARGSEWASEPGSASAWESELGSASALGLAPALPRSARWQWLG
ncbi:MAG: hypothetical protein PHU85_11090, partial [Phycisphaerae bacterium]|nr:hypothetical protein [Phycisphaerae bacterium]